MHLINKFFGYIRAQILFWTSFPFFEQVSLESDAKIA